MKRKIINAIEIAATQGIINLPNLHVLIYEENETLISGHCLDLDIWAYSEAEDRSVAIEHIYERILQMAIVQILAIFENDALDKIYANKVDDENEWQKFNTINNQEKAKRLKDSMNNLKDFKFSSEAIETAMTQDDINKLVKIMETLNIIEPGIRSRTLQDFIDLCTKLYRKQVMAVVA